LLEAGGYALRTIPVEVFPDLVNNQVFIVSEAPSLPPTQVERFVTYPIERAMLGPPEKEEVRSLSKLGLSMLTGCLTIRCRCISRGSWLASAPLDTSGRVVLASNAIVNSP
jgi:hypothetical protein